LYAALQKIWKGLVSVVGKRVGIGFRKLLANILEHPIRASHAAQMVMDQSDLQDKPPSNRKRFKAIPPKYKIKTIVLPVPVATRFDNRWLLRHFEFQNADVFRKQSPLK
jgi:hypothetical protein